MLNLQLYYLISYYLKIWQTNFSKTKIQIQFISLFVPATQNGLIRSVREITIMVSWYPKSEMISEKKALVAKLPMNVTITPISTKLINSGLVAASLIILLGDLFLGL